MVLKRLLLVASRHPKAATKDALNHFDTADMLSFLFWLLRSTLKGLSDDDETE